MRLCLQITSFFLAVHFHWRPLAAQDSSCCQHAAEFSPCKEACDQLATIKSESRLKNLLQKLPSYCPEAMNELWTCINSSLPGVSRKSEGWVGLGCCELAISAECRRECRQASSKNEITKVCKKVTENSLYSCITKNEMGSTCCSYAGRHTTCREYCQAIFRTDSTPTVSQITAVTEYCQSHSAQLLGCVGNFTKSYPIRSPIDSLYCCDRAKAHCQVACRRILRTMSTEHEIMEGLIAECGSQPLPQEPMWQCFLGSGHPPSPPEEETPHPAKMDCAKLHCCSKANTSLCRDMCQEISTNWGSQTWQDFDQLCEYNPVETELINCLADVREPCQLGCKDLGYCTNFNNRPTELFRSCSVQSDQGAMNDIKLWSNGTIKMPFMNIPVLDIRTCLPDMWKAVACSLQIKPCHSKSRGSVICKSDCLDILTQCGDRKRFHEGQTPERICELLSPIDDPERCIPLQRYLVPSSLGNSVVEEVIHPCNPNPCPSSHLCQVNRKGCLDELTCQPFLCVPGCKLGEASDFLVQQDSLIQVPTRSGPTGCHEVCSCGLSGRLENCVEMPCWDPEEPCVVGGQRRSHGSSFKVDCHTCSCFSGETICSSRECLDPDSSEEVRQHFTGVCVCLHQSSSVLLQVFISPLSSCRSPLQLSGPLRPGVCVQREDVPQRLRGALRGLQGPTVRLRPVPPEQALHRGAMPEEPEVRPSVPRVPQRLLRLSSVPVRGPPGAVRARRRGAGLRHRRPAACRAVPAAPGRQEPGLHGPLPGRLPDASPGVRPQRGNLRQRVRRRLRPRRRGLRGPVPRRGRHDGRGAHGVRRHPLPPAGHAGLPARHAARSLLPHLCQHAADPVEQRADEHLL
ncbi:reversion-inducing cysteine-rich protein with Kazal motifs isoform X2 [Pseudoliparis swirei]|uniref:reversion-inducing cysteine-rich protein with Kazal motifs isoform X2 n=1 Tax=Pseudoliparis swirei TaxID=2059687 RepID=UPI0024BDEC17|nr:reversion-inducing cysteine-rich protein with Kazal motifs isoform X2 [Pseudoliparis swirei]